MLMSVLTRALPRAGIVVSREAYMSYPAANSLPRVGRRPLSESFLICSWESMARTVLTRLAGGEELEVVLMGVASASTVMVVAGVDLGIVVRGGSRWWNWWTMELGVEELK